MSSFWYAKTVFSLQVQDALKRGSIASNNLRRKTFRILPLTKLSCSNSLLVRHGIVQNAEELLRAIRGGMYKCRAVVGLFSMI